MSFKRISVSFPGVVRPFLYAVWLTVGIIFKIEKQIIWHKLTNPLLSFLLLNSMPPNTPVSAFLSLTFRLFYSSTFTSSSSTCSTYLHPFLTYPPPPLPPLSLHSAPPPPPHPHILLYFLLIHCLFLLFHLHILIPPPQFPSHLLSHPPLPPPLPYPHTFFKLRLHCFPTCASIPLPLCNLPPPF